MAAAYRNLLLSVLAFAACFAVWMMNGVLVTFLVDHQVFAFSRSEIGWLLGVPVLTGAVLRLPAGMAADRFGGRSVMVAMMFFAAAACLATSFASGFGSMLLGGLGFGVAGASFAVGVAYVSCWFPREKQGTALGIFGAGNAGAVATNMAAPLLLSMLTDHGTNPERWRLMPRVYAIGLVAAAVVFALFADERRDPEAAGKTTAMRLAPLKSVRVWRFGLYYCLFFGGYVALSQWLIAYYVNLYAMPLAAAGALTALFAFPANLMRAAGGVVSDRIGARRAMYWSLGGCIAAFLLLSMPRMDMQTPAQGVTAEARGTVERISESSVVVSGREYPLRPEPPKAFRRAGMVIWPTKDSWQTPVVAAGDKVEKRQLLARGITHIYFQANEWIFTALLVVAGSMMGLGMAAVYRHIPMYFPGQVGVVGGIVGMLGGLGGFVAPVLFGYLLDAVGLWITCWLAMAALAIACLALMHLTIRKMVARATPHLAQRFEHLPIDAVLENREAVCLVHGVRADIVVARPEEQAKGCALDGLLRLADRFECKRGAVDLDRKATRAAKVGGGDG